MLFWSQLGICPCACSGRPFTVVFGRAVKQVIESTNDFLEALALDSHSGTDCPTQHQGISFDWYRLSSILDQQRWPLVSVETVSVITVPVAVECSLVPMDGGAFVALVSVWCFQRRISWWMRKLARRQQFREETTMTEADDGGNGGTWDHR